MFKLTLSISQPVICHRINSTNNSINFPCTTTFPLTGRRLPQFILVPAVNGIFFSPPKNPFKATNMHSHFSPRYIARRRRVLSISQLHTASRSILRGMQSLMHFIEGCLLPARNSSDQGCQIAPKLAKIRKKNSTCRKRAANFYK